MQERERISHVTLRHGSVGKRRRPKWRAWLWGFSYTVWAWTKSEARAAIKAHQGKARLPIGMEVLRAR